MSWSGVQGVLPTVQDLVTEVTRKVSWRRPRTELGYRSKRVGERIKGKFCPWAQLTKHYDKKMYIVVQVLPPCLTSVLYGGELSASPSHLASSIHWIGPRAGLDAVGQETKKLPCSNQAPTL
jgi:hypothetical protein